MPSNLAAPFRSLRNPVFARLYVSQTASLLGDAFTWVGLALLAFQLRGKDSASILAFALTMRVAAYILLSPLAGVVADRINRKLILVVCDVARMLVIGLMPFTTQIWQVYSLMFLVNAFTAFFTPTFQATIPAVTKDNHYSQAISLSGATNELLGVLGPGIAGGIAVFIGSRNIFFIDAASFLISASLIMTVRAPLRTETVGEEETKTDIASLTKGSRLLWGNRPMRRALLLELVASMSGAFVLVNTVGYVRGALGLGESGYGWAMAAFGIGATAAAFLLGVLEQRVSRQRFLTLGAILTSAAILPANYVAFVPLMGLWLLAGAGQNFVNLATQTVIADETEKSHQGRVYGAHFAWSHLWWAIAYPVAGLLGERATNRAFLYGGGLSLVIFSVVFLVLGHQRNEAEKPKPGFSR